jgi:hypothetical protein
VSPILRQCKTRRAGRPFGPVHSIENKHPGLSSSSYACFSLVVCCNRSSQSPSVSTPTIRSPLTRSPAPGSTKPKKSKVLASLRVDSGRHIRARPLAQPIHILFSSANARSSSRRSFTRASFPADCGLARIHHHPTLPYLSLQPNTTFCARTVTRLFSVPPETVLFTAFAGSATHSPNPFVLSPYFLCLFPFSLHDQ